MRQRTQSVIDELQFIVFRIGSREYALGILQVERIMPFERSALSSSPRGPAAWLLSQGDRTLPVLDLRPRLGDEAVDREETRIMITDLGGLSVGLVVDQVSQALRIDSRTIQVPEGAGFPPFASGVFTTGDRRIIVCHASRLVDDRERLALT